MRRPVIYLSGVDREAHIKLLAQYLRLQSRRHDREAVLPGLSHLPEWLHRNPDPRT